MNKNRVIKSIIVSVVIFTSIVLSEADYQFTQQRHLMNQRYAGLSGTGVALPEPASSATMNPALIHRFHINSKTNLSITAGFDRDSLFNKMILTGGASYYLNERTTIGAQYRYLANSEDKLTNEGIITISGTLFDQGDDEQGGVDIGMNMRYLQTKWNSNFTAPLKIIQQTTNDSGYIINNNTIGTYSSNQFNLTEQNEYRLLFDIGFYQNNIINNLDFALVFYNILGFQWNAKSPVANSSSTLKNIGDSTGVANDTIVDSLFYKDDWNRDHDKNHKSYKRMTLGFAYHMPISENKIDMIIPFDFEFLRMFNRDEKTKLAIHTGLELWLIGGRIGLRGGYSRSPSYIYDTPGNFKIEKTNILTAGASLRLKMFGIDGYFTEYKKEWGVSGFVSF